ncbi:hypothetical protein [Paenibacillus hubeiensis]|uniref:hypothetical protein n=1 Tax=Paenibacillus hubeiensis TaxID=3077330 RepID=UPI0031BB9B4E
MSEYMKVEFEIRALGAESVPGYESCYRQHEIARMLRLPEDTTLRQIEEIAKKLIAEVKEQYSQPEQLLVKVTIRGREMDGELKVLG